MSSLFTDLQKMFEKMLDKLLIPFDIVVITTKVTTENMQCFHNIYRQNRPFRSSET